MASDSEGLRRAVVCAILLAAASGAASVRAQDASSGGAPVSGQITCLSRSLTLCRDEFCFVSFDEGRERSFRIDLDLDRKSYVVPVLEPDVKPMRIVATEQTKGHLALKFGIELAHGRPANVEFLANAKEDGSVTMSAASRAVAPATGERSAILAVTALECRKQAE